MEIGVDKVCLGSGVVLVEIGVDDFSYFVSIEFVDEFGDFVSICFGVGEYV